jgi:hypothetical protein
LAPFFLILIAAAAARGKVKRRLKWKHFCPHRRHLKGERSNKIKSVSFDYIRSATFCSARAGGWMWVSRRCVNLKS